MSCLDDIKSVDEFEKWFNEARNEIPDACMRRIKEDVKGTFALPHFEEWFRKYLIECTDLHPWHVKKMTEEELKRKYEEMLRDTLTEKLKYWGTEQ